MSFWLHLTKKWRTEKGGNGLTLPFIAGAEARWQKCSATAADARKLVDEIKAFEDPRTLVVVHWCTWRLAPVIGPYAFNRGGVQIDEQLLVGDMTKERFWDSLARDAGVRVEAGDFSRIGTPPRWAPFTDEDKKFIDSAIFDYD